MLEAAQDLYALAPAEFIAARTQLAKELKAAGRADDAAIVAKLRKPRMAEWALNRLAREQRDVVDRFALAIAAAQAAQSAAIGGTTGDIREATTELRQATSAAADAAVRGLTTDGGNGEAQRDDLTTILREMVGAADATPLLAGVIGSEALVASGEFFPGAPDPPMRSRRPSSTDADADADADAVTGAAQTAATASTAAASTSRAPTSASSKSTPSASSASSSTAVGARAAKDSSATDGRVASTAAARRAMARAERHGLQQAVTVSERAVVAAQANFDAAAAELARRASGLEAARAAATAAASALATFDAEQAPTS